MVHFELAATWLINYTNEYVRMRVFAARKAVTSHRDRAKYQPPGFDLLNQTRVDDVSTLFCQATNTVDITDLKLTEPNIHKDIL